MCHGSYKSTRSCLRPTKISGTRHKIRSCDKQSNCHGPQIIFYAMGGPLNDFQRPLNVIVTALGACAGQPQNLVGKHRRMFRTQKLQTPEI